MSAKSLVGAQVSGLCRHGKGLMYGTYDGKLHVCDADAAKCKAMAGPSAQSVLQCLVDPANTDRLYVLAAGSKVHHSDDGGATWEFIVGGI